MILYGIVYGYYSTMITFLSVMVIIYGYGKNHLNETLDEKKTLELIKHFSPSLTNIDVETHH